MGAGYEVKWVAQAGVASARVRQEVEAFLATATAAFSTWDETSVISHFNRHASLEPFEVPDQHRARFVAVLRLALDVAERTDGAFDPTIQPLVELLGFGRGEHLAPTASERAAAVARVGWRKVRILDDGRLQKLATDVQITLSGLVPGWAADEIVVVLGGLGLPDCMVDVGGEIACRGTKAPGQPWTIGIERPASPGAPPRVHTEVPLEGGLATSGNYRNFHLVGDEIVHHLLDPRTGTNVRHGWASVSVRTDSAGLADALATAFMVNPEQAAAVVDGFYPRRVSVLFLAPPHGDGVVREQRIGW